MRRALSVLVRQVVVLAVVVFATLPVSPSASAAIWDKFNDFNNDNISDVVAINGTNGCLYRWNGDGAGDLGAATRVGCGWGPTPTRSRRWVT